MLRRFSIGALAVAAFGLFSTTGARADQVFTWTLPASPTITSGNFINGSFFQIPGVTFTENGITETGMFGFFPTGNGGGFDLSAGGQTILNDFGQQVYTGPAGDQEGMPTFLPGTYGLNGEPPATFLGPGTLSITSTGNGNDQFTYTAATPEPGSLLLLGTGLLSLIGLAPKRISA